MKETAHELKYGSSVIISGTTIRFILPAPPLSRDTGMGASFYVCAIHTYVCVHAYMHTRTREARGGGRLIPIWKASQVCPKYVPSQNRGNSPYSPHNSPNANSPFGRIFTEPVSDFPEKTPAVYCLLVENNIPWLFLILFTTSVLFRCSR